MKNIELLLISIALAMDAFSVSICKGLTMKYHFIRNSIILSISFSFFQMLMPLIGYYLGSNLNIFLINFNHIIAFVLLSIIGINMIKESYNDDINNISFNIKELFILSIATSIDAMTVGITFSLFPINLIKTILMIGIITFILSLIGVNIGKKLGKKLEKTAEIIGGIILILLGIKFLLEYFNVL